MFFCFCSSIKFFHFHQYFPHWSLSSSVSTIRGVPSNSTATSPLLVLPPANQRWHERNRHFTCNILRNQEKHRRTSLLRPFSTLLHFLQEFYDFSSRFFCQVQRIFGGIHRISLLSVPSFRSDFLCQIFHNSRPLLSSLHFLILYLLFLRTLLHSKGSPLPLNAALFDLAQFSRPTFTNMDPFRSGSDLSIFSFLPCLPPQR